MKQAIYQTATACVLGLALSTQACADQEKHTMLQCALQAPVHVKAGQAVPLRFTLSNTGETQLAVLKWNTPLEGWFADSFKVTKDGHPVMYIGAMVKRFRPSAEDYVQIAPGKSVDAEVNLAEAYDMKAPGSYSVAFRGRLQDVQQLAAGQTPSSARKLHNIQCNVLTVSVDP